MSKAFWGVGIADLHSGSLWGVSRPEVEISGEGDLYVPGKLGKWLFDEYCRLVDKYPHPDFLLFLGDSVDGRHKKNKGQGTWSNDLKLQCKEAVALLNMWEAKAVYGVQGTQYHIDYINCDELVLQDVKNAVPRGSRYAPPDRYVDVNGITIHMGHKSGNSSVFKSQATQAAKPLEANRVMQAEAAVLGADLILRGHTHHYAEVRLGKNGRSVNLPCWKARGDYEALHRPFMWNSQIGIVVIEISSTGHLTIEPELIDLEFQCPELESLETALNENKKTDSKRVDRRDARARDANLHGEEGQGTVDGGERSSPPQILWKGPTGYSCG